MFVPQWKALFLVLCFEPVYIFVVHLISCCSFHFLLVVSSNILHLVSCGFAALTADSEFSF